MEGRSTPMEISTDVGGTIFASLEVSGSVYGTAWTFPPSEEVKACVASTNCSFHEYIPWKRQ